MGGLFGSEVVEVFELDLEGEEVVVVPALFHVPKGRSVVAEGKGFEHVGREVWG